MYETEKFVQDSVLLIILTLVSVFTSEYPYIMLLLCGILMVFLTVRSISDRQEKIPFVMQILISVIFAVISGGTFTYLILSQCRGNKIVRLAVPSVAYLAVQTLSQKMITPKILYNTLIIFALVLIILFAEKLIIEYLSAKNQITRTVSVTAVNEMYEKKLNQELIMKNYLADKNARLEERENISRNIHNSVGHSITAAIMTLDAADMLFDTYPCKAREKMNAANVRIRSSLDSIRHAVRVLDSESEFISMSDLIGELTAVADSFMMDTMIKILCDFPESLPDMPIPHEHTEFLTGAVQELLTNGARHGNADMFTVSLIADSGHIKLSVCDNGASDFSPRNSQEKIRNGFGLKKLISYAEKCGGSAFFENENGFRSVITLPLYREEKYE